MNVKQTSSVLGGPNCLLGGSDRVKSIFEKSSTKPINGLLVSCFLMNWTRLLLSSVRDAGGASDRVLNQLLIEMDGMDAEKTVFIIGATNRPDVIYQALLRPGRLEQLIYIPLPDEESRHKIFKTCLRKSPVAEDVSIRKLAEHTQDFSGADITEICRRACRFAIKESIDRDIERKKKKRRIENPGPSEEDRANVKAANFEESMKFARSVSDADIRKYRSFAQKVHHLGGFRPNFG